MATFQRTGLTPKKPCSRKVPVQRLSQIKFAKILLGQLLAWQSLEEIFLKICFILPVSDFLKVAFLRFRVPGGFGRSGVLDRSGEIFCWQMLRDLAKFLQILFGTASGLVLFFGNRVSLESTLFSERLPLQRSRLAKVASSTTAIWRESAVVLRFLYARFEHCTM